MNDKYSTTEGKTSEKLSDEAMLSAQWKSIDWHKAEREVNRLQIRIVKATQQKDYNAVKRLQYLLTHSFYAKALAVKRVVTNDGRRTPGVDGVLWNTPAKKMAAALSLTDKRYRARPLRRVYIEKKDKKKKRPLGIAALQQDSQIAAAHPQDKENFCGMTIKGMVYDDKKAAGERLLLARQEMPNADMMLLGTYRGFELNIRFDSFKNEHQAVLRAELSYPVSLGDDARGNITRLDNAIDNFADRIADAENALQNLEQQKQAAEVEVAKPFAQEEELAEKSARLAELNALLNIDRDRSSSQDAPEETEETETPATRPSVLSALEEKVNQPEPVKPFKSYLDKEGR